MLIEKVVLLNAEKTKQGYTAEVELETADGFGFCGPIEFDKDWNYSLGFLNTFVNTDEDRHFVNEVLSSEDFKNDVMSYIPS
ncbi:hypothetical protein ACFZ8N_00185 [Acinetobacter baumannii]|uniref:hypothetical protein n=1 Tax=Acinetobacter baumannii TaxID=470 RepID=UPI0008242180|nr:hypothetical protein [Acinetobacter baumannii]MBD0490280.1 hypothetical protein [Acinetobacter baumannii]MCF4280607.1 hypothetical protein [Acinetobacter baumannii]MCF4299328.1 hypothetical protein [Acinetobacter baumannii]NAS38325.1 hypothetical protein [Acinetobacter baumannii]TPS43891.1 hypothetical protein FJU83_18445 [Acinetobacter baumannii]